MSGIADADGPDNAVFSYQWLADGSDIEGATGSTYTLADVDDGKAITVRVSFTDDAGNEEALTSLTASNIRTALTMEGRWPCGFRLAYMSNRCSGRQPFLPLRLT